MLSLIVIVVLSYLVGSIPGSLWVGKSMYGIDVRERGSGNLGATNVFRVLGWKAGLLATAVDMGKGALAAGVIAGLRIDGLPSGLPVWDIETVVRLCAGIAAMAGHMFPVWAHFRGGKGVNTAAGVLLALTPVNLLLALAVFFVMLLVFRYVSLASITATVAFPTILALRKYVWANDALDASLLVFSIVMALGIVIAHRSNILRLVRGNENRISLQRTAREGSQPVS